MASLKTYYAKAIKNWLVNNPGHIVRKLQDASLFNEACIKTTTMQTAENGFRKTNIFPMNPDAFNDSVFLAHKLEQQAEERAFNNQPSDEEPSTNCTLRRREEIVEPNSIVVSLQDIRPVPVILPSISTQTGSTVLVTGTPHK